MRNPRETLLQNKSLIFKTVLIFLSAYLISLFLWIQIKDTYGYVITATASMLVAEVKNVRVEKIRQEKDIVYISFCRSMRKEDMVIELAFKTSSYTFNVPLTFSIMASLCLFVTRRHRAYTEAALLLVIVHLIYVFSLGAEHLTVVFMGKGIEGISMLKLFLYQFLWGFTDNMLIRCEPFLIGFYIYVRFKKQDFMNRNSLAASS
jgi:hypothetical protein